MTFLRMYVDGHLILMMTGSHVFPEINCDVVHLESSYK